MDNGVERDGAKTTEGARPSEVREPTPEEAAAADAARAEIKAMLSVVGTGTSPVRPRKRKPGVDEGQPDASS